MKVKNHFIYMANYNCLMNHQILSVVEGLSDDALTEDKGAFFQSIMGTLNHILVGDIIWLTLFNLHATGYESLKGVIEQPKPQGFSDILYPDVTSYK